MKNAIPYIEDIQFISKTDFLILRKPVLEVTSEPYFWDGKNNWQTPQLGVFLD